MSNPEIFGGRYEVIRPLKEAAGARSLLGKDRERLWLVRPFVPGLSVRERLDRGPLAVGGAIRVGRSLMEALARAHAHGVLHGNVRPSNLILKDGSEAHGVVVVDFELGRGEWPESVQETSVLKAATYMSPEQAGLLKQDVDARSGSCSKTRGKPTTRT